METSTNRFIRCPVACVIWKYIVNIWQVMTHCYLMPRQWVFAQYVQGRSCFNIWGIGDCNIIGVCEMLSYLMENMGSRDILDDMAVLVVTICGDCF